MNDQRRKDISNAIEALRNASSDIDNIRDEEQGYLDNMPESFQEGDRGQAAQEAIDALDEAISFIDEAIDGAKRAGG